MKEVNTEGLNFFGAFWIIHKGLCLATLENLMKEWLGGYHVVLKSAKKVHVDRPILAIVYKNIYHKFLVFIALKGAGSTEPGFPYLYWYPDNCSIVSICPIIFPHVVGRNFSVCNRIINHNRMWKSYLALEKYYVTQSGYFRPVTAVALVMGITYWKL